MKVPSIHILTPFDSSLVKVNMSLFSICQWRLIGPLTLKTGQKVIAKKKLKKEAATFPEAE